MRRCACFCNSISTSKSRSTTTVIPNRRSIDVPSVHCNVCVHHFYRQHHSRSQYDAGSDPRYATRYPAHAAASALGNLVVTLLQATISIAGSGAVLVASESIFQMIKFAGAAYLVFLGIGLLRSPALAVARPGARSDGQKTCLKKLFLQAVMVTAGNPKAIVFFSAVFPQFIDPQATYVNQFVLLMGIGAIIAFSCFMLYAIAGQKIVHFLMGNGWEDLSTD